MKLSSKELFIISLTIFITILIWIFVDVYHINKNEKYTVDYSSSMKMEIREIKGKTVLNTLMERQ
ncbi:MAG: hypothetical protein NUV65_05515 [Candidatus Roizmanbacteria bacterium]|nr:hypothetical protein [Candidatus Roizmanbacteria bacterium]